MHVTERLRADDESATIWDGSKKCRASSFWDEYTNSIRLEVVISFDSNSSTCDSVSGAWPLDIGHMRSAPTFRGRSTSFAFGNWACALVCTLQIAYTSLSQASATSLHRCHYLSVAQSLRRSLSSYSRLSPCSRLSPLPPFE